MASTLAFSKLAGVSKESVGLAERSDGARIGDVDPAEASVVLTSTTVIPTAAGEQTEGFDPIACFDDRFRQAREPVGPLSPGRYIQVQGPNQRLLIRLGDEVTHIGRGLAANLRLDDSSVSRRHAVLVSRSSGHRILDDRSLNGTFVNGRRVERSDLRDGDVITIGRVMLRYLDA